MPLPKILMHSNLDSSDSDEAIQVDSPSSSHAAKPTSAPKTSGSEQEKESVHVDEDKSSVDSSEHYSVEAILDKRTESGRLMYLIKWRGYAEHESTWEPAENCDCDELIKEFEAKEAEKRQSRKKTNRKSALEPPTESNSTDKRKRAKRTSSIRETISSTQADICQISCTKDNSEVPSEHADSNDASDRYIEVIGMSQNKEGYLYVVKMKQGDIIALSSSVAKQLVPQKIIDFYESRLILKEKSQHDSVNKF
ncbi:hypothetical protein ACOME3_004787 [Neoechinorhynchus agilis]